MEKFVK